MKRLLALTAAACLIAAPLSFAQTNPQQTPPAATQPAPPSTPTPQPSTPPAEPAATPAPAPAGDARCRTSKEAGEQCSCLSAPTEFGTAAPAANGSHNMCMVPAAAAPSSTPQQ